MIGPHGGYRKTLSFGFACLVYHATTAFCRRNYNYRNDTLGKTVGQMVGAARSARQNIVEGSARAGTSRETELRLLDVAKASLEELAGDFEAYIVEAGEIAWSERDPRAARIREIVFEEFREVDDQRHAYGRHFLEMRKRFAPDLENGDPVHAANAILVAIDRACSLLYRQMDRIGREVRGQAGLSERLGGAHATSPNGHMVDQEVPHCPECGGPMRRRVARKGPNAGNPFWSCQAYPNCSGTRPWK